jgi:hypothetical protein
MRRTVRHIVVAAGLVGIGWTIGHSQTTAPDFEFSVSAPGGETIIQCLRGCEVSWVARGLNANAVAASNFTFSCGAERCDSGAIGGWIRP